MSSKKHSKSSGNVFADVNIPQSALYLAKASLAHQICRARRLRSKRTKNNAKLSNLVDKIE